MKIAVVGGGAAGLCASLLLARGGHEVVLVEAGSLTPPPDVESAALQAFRLTAPQVVQPHAVMARCRLMLRERLPDVHAGLIAAGAAEAPLSALMPPALTDRRTWTGDQDLTMILTRRSTVDWVLQRAVAGQRGLTVRDRTRVAGLLGVPGDPPRVVGLRTDRGDLTADVVIDASGRRSLTDRWLADVGTRPAPTWSADCGIAYYSRHYRIRSGCPRPIPRAVATLDEFTVALFGADNGIVQVCLAPLAADRRFHRLRHVEAFTAVAHTVPILADCLAVAEPVTGVFPMAGLRNTLRRLVAEGDPVVLGLHAVGDAVCTTNPTFGRGLALALHGAADLVDVLTAHGDDPYQQAVALDALIGQHIVPFFRDQAAIDAGRLAMLRHTIMGTPAPHRSPGGGDRITYAELQAAASVDPVVFRAFWRLQGAMCLPDQVYADPDVVARTRAVLPGHEILAAPQPSHDELLAALGT